MNLPGVDLIDKRHQDESVEDDRQVNRGNIRSRSVIIVEIDWTYVIKLNIAYHTNIFF